MGFKQSSQPSLLVGSGEPDGKISAPFSLAMTVLVLALSVPGSIVLDRFAGLAADVQAALDANMFTPWVALLWEGIAGWEDRRLRVAQDCGPRLREPGVLLGGLGGIVALAPAAEASKADRTAFDEP